MLTALLLALIGSADLWRSWGRARGDVFIAVGIASSWVLLVVLGATGLGLPLQLVALVVLASGTWLWLTTPDEHETGRAGRAAVVGLLVFVVVLFLFDRTALEASGYLVDGHRLAASALLREAPLTAVATVVGVALFLCESANIVVRIALRSPAQASRAEPEEVDLTRVDLKGGRLIGPLERLLIVALVLTGFPPIVAALVAAKGIVRFPEIADDVRKGDGLSGTKAEYFLVGSLVSWAVAGAAVGLLAIAAHS
jgi:hypothetical protein